MRLSESLKYWTEKQPDKLAFTQIFLDETKKEITYKELNKAVDNYGYALIKKGIKYDDKCMLIFHDIIECVIAFMACNRIGAIAIPLYIPKEDKDFEMWRKIKKETECRWLLTDQETAPYLEKNFSDMVVSYRNGKEEDHIVSEYINNIAFLQYTSGSTGNPKGVMITNNGLAANMKGIAKKLEYTKDSVIVTWLPYYHDLGLVVMLLESIYQGAQSIAMNPEVFTQNPLLWMQAISKYHATITGAPNFAYEIMAKALKNYEEDLDLSSLKIAFSGGEAIKINSILKFYKQSKRFGMDQNALIFGYGQAEATLVIAVNNSDEKIGWTKIERKSLNEEKLRVIEEGFFSGEDDFYDTDREEELYIIGNGTALSNHTITIRNPKTGETLPAYTVGEICYSGPSLSLGYYNQKEKTEEILKKDIHTEKYLRTGDLGFLNKRGELFITGRIKEMMVIQGANYYPQDIEELICELDDSFYKSGSAAFSIPSNDSERLIIAQEIKKSFVDNYKLEDYIMLESIVRKEMLRVYSMLPQDIIFVEEEKIPRTASGKIRRIELKDLYLKQKVERLNAIQEIQKETSSSSVESIKFELKRELAKITAISLDDIREDDTFESMGITSVLALKLSLDYMSKFKGTSIQDIYKYNTIHLLADYLVEKEKSQLEIKHYDLMQKEYPLSEIQSAYYTGRNKEIQWGGIGCYYTCEIDQKELDLDRFKKAYKKLVEHQSMLRCVINENGKQEIKEKVSLPFIYYEYPVLGKSLSEHLKNVRKEMKTKEFSAGEPLYEIRISKLEEGYRIHIGMDLIIGDAMSVLLLLNDLEDFYNGVHKKSLRADYREYVLREIDSKNSPEYSRDEAYWIEKAKDFSGAPHLPLKTLDEGNLKGRFKRRLEKIDADTWRKFEKNASKHQLTPSMVMMQLYATVLQAYGCGDSFEIMTTVLVRQPYEKDVYDVIGDYTKLMLVKMKDENGTFLQRTTTLQNEVRENLSHLNYSALDLTRELKKSGKEAFYPVVFTSVLDAEISKEKNNSFFDHIRWSYSQTPQVFLDFQAVKNEDCVFLSFDSVDDLFIQNTISDMFQSLIMLVYQVAENENFFELESIDCRTTEQIEEQERANATEHLIQGNYHLLGFLQDIDSHKDQIAIICNEREYTYGELLERAEEIATYLQNKGLRKKECVIVEMKKSFEQIASILAILLAGGTYIGVMANMGIQRLLTIKEKSKSRFILSDDNELEDKIKVDTIKEKNKQDFDFSFSNCDDTAYVIFTSGSTGEPKGVPITHRQAMNTILSINKMLNVSEQDKFLGVSMISFDLSVYDIFGCFQTYGTLVLPTDEERMDPGELASLIEKYEVSIYNSVPSIMEIIVEGIHRKRITSLRSVLLSGDWISLNLPTKIKKYFPNAQVISLGGATEASIWSNYFVINKVEKEWNSIPYGYPLPNQKFYIVNKKNQLVPRGVEGRLLIAGKGIANGYLNDPELTKEAFWNLNGTAVYETGDYGRYMENGCIEFLGRKDNQVKINGYRIELTEIEKAFSKIGIDARCKLIVGGEKIRERRLYAFVEKEDLSEEDTKKLLLDCLPKYCIPHRIFGVKALPLTANGKCNEKKLLKLAEMQPKKKKKDSVKTDKIGKKVLKIAREVFHVEDIVPETTLGQIGATSIDIIRFANKLELEFKSRPAIKDLMNYGEFSQIIEFYGESDIEEPEEKIEEIHGFSEKAKAYIQTIEYPNNEEEREELIKQNTSYRYEFHNLQHVPIEETTLNELLKVLNLQTENYEKKFLYTSIKNLYCMQIYISIAKNQDFNMDPGQYYFDNQQGNLIKISNNPFYKKTAIHFVCDLQAAYPVYKEDTYKNVCLELGGIWSLLKQSTTRFSLKPILLKDEEKKELENEVELFDRHEYMMSFILDEEKKKVDSQIDCKQVLTQYAKDGIQLYVEDKKLKFKALHGAMTSEKKKYLKENKEELLKYLIQKDEYLPKRYQPFNLTPIQKAYLIGRESGYELGNVNAHYYIEFECKRVDVNAFENALNKLIRMNDMLRTVVHEDGLQQVLTDVPYLKVNVVEDVTEEERIALRKELKQKEYPLGQWPMFHFEITRKDAAIDRIHLSLDCILLDAYSTQCFVNDIFKLLNGEKIEPTNYTFKQYIEHEKEWVKERGLEERAKEYWNKRIDQIPKAPQIPFKVSHLFDIEKPTFERKCNIFSEKETEQFMKRVKRANTTANAVIAYCFMDTLSKCCKQPELTLNLTMYNRRPIHKDVESIYGDFTATGILSYKRNKDSIISSVRKVQDGMQRAIEYNAYNGIEILKQIPQDYSGQALMPVVLTSMLQDVSLTDFTEVYAVSATPQVVLDGQAYFRGKSMVVGFDYVKEAMDDEWLSDFYDQYILKIKSIIHTENWYVNYNE